MDPNKKKNDMRTLTWYVLFGIALAFAVTILIFGIYLDVFPPIAMAILIGVLVALAVKLFSDALKRDQRS